MGSRPWQGIVGQCYPPDAFEVYMQKLTLDAWKPSFCVLHHTAEPTLANWPNATGKAHIAGLAHYYRDTLHWSAGPHLFVAPEGIWIFTPLTVHGVHSPSWNEVSWGVEQVGNYETESYTSGAGARVAHNAVCALASLHAKLHLDTSTLKFHKEDPATTHKSCPGKNCVKAEVVQRVHDLILQRQNSAPA